MLRSFARKLKRLSTPFSSFINQKQQADTETNQAQREMAEKLDRLVAEGKDIKTALTELFGAKTVAGFEKWVEQCENRPHKPNLKGNKPNSKTAKDFDGDEFFKSFKPKT